MQLPVGIRDRRWRSVLPELTGTGATPADSATSWLGGGQRPTARQREQVRSRPGDTMAMLAAELAELGGQGANHGDAGLADS
jgi:hypothetical protein